MIFMEKDHNQDMQQPSGPQEFNTDAAMEKTPRSSEGGTSSKLIWGVVALVVALAVAVGAWMTYSGGLGLGGDPSDNGGAVATVNGEEISRDKYERRVSQQTQGQQEPSELDQQVRDQILSSLIAEELVLQAVEQAGASPSEEEVESQISQARSQFPDDASFASALEAQGFTESSFRSFVVDQVAIQNYLASQVDVDSITVTDQEIQSFYDQSFSGSEDAPALDEVRTQIESQIRTQKQQQLVSEFIDSLRQQAEIEILI